MIDSHCHIDFAEFDEDREQIIEQCLSVGMERILIPGVYVDQFEALLKLKSSYPLFDIAFGLHPYFLVSHAPENTKEKLTHLAMIVDKHRNQLSALGEMGIDSSIDVPLEQQIESLEGQIEIAKDFQLPLILHHRKSHNLLIHKLKKSKFTYGGIIHAFSGSTEVAHTYQDLGFKLGIGGTITYERALKTIKAIIDVGIGALVIETDSPAMPLSGFQGQRNSPTLLPLIVNRLAEILRLSVDQVTEKTTQNYLSVISS